MSTTLTALPNEILVEITKRLGHDSQSLARLARCCRRFYQVVIPQLYRNVTFGGDFQRLVQFTSTIVRKPTYASRVRGFIIHYDMKSHLSKNETFFRDLNKSHKEHPKDGLSVEVPELGRVFWLKEESRDLLVEAVLALLLRALTQLRWLDLDLPIDVLDAHLHSYTVHYSIVKMLARKSPTGLRNLTYFLGTFEHRFDHHWSHGIPERNAALLFQVPTLQAFIGRISGNNSDKGAPSAESLDKITQGNTIVWALGSLLPQSSRVTYLELRHTEMDVKDIACMVKACISLRTFILEWNIGFADRKLPFNTSQIRRCFESAAPSLKYLSLEYWMCYTMDYWKIPSNRVIAPLSTFLNLDHVRLGMVYIFGRESHLQPFPEDDESVDKPQESSDQGLCGILPPNIRVLSLLYNYGEIVPCKEEFNDKEDFNDPYPLMQSIADLLDVSAEKFPRLHTINIEITYLHQPPTTVFEGFQAMQKRCAEVGISLEQNISESSDQGKMRWGMERKARLDSEQRLLGCT